MQAFGKQWGWLLVAAFVLLQPVKNLFELPVALMALFGLIQLVRHPRDILGMPATRVVLLMFAAFWVPMLLSLTDAVSFRRSLETTLVFLRFPLAAVFACWALAQDEARHRLMMVLGIALSLSAFDIVMQATLGHDLFGVPPSGGRMTGLIHGKLVAGHLMAVMSPVFFAWVRHAARQRLWLWGLVPLFVAAILLTGSRAAWVMLAVGVLLMGWQMFSFEGVRLHWRTVVAGMSMILLTLVGLQHQAEWQRKMDVTAGLFSGNYEQANDATSNRLPIWQVGLQVARDHWVNGVGPRGFRYIYPEYVPKNDYWLQFGSGTGPTHPHQTLLEISAETGLVGLLFYLAAMGYWGRRMLKAGREHRFEALPWMSAVLIALMPINAHMAIYASFWSCVTWWLVALAAAHLQAGRPSAHS